MLCGKKILVLGSNGLAGQEFKIQLKQHQCVLKTVARVNSDFNLDLNNFETLLSMLKNYEPDVIINCCAVVDLYKCELSPFKSRRINYSLVELLSDWCNAHGKKLLQISTDHYYNYGDDYAHKEFDPIVTLNEYSRQKLSAEFVAMCCPSSLVLRTSITGVKNLNNPITFFDWAYDVCINSKEATLFTDAYTSTLDISTFVKFAIKLVQLDASGLYNLASSEVYTKAEFVIGLAELIGVTTENFSESSILDLSSNKANCLGLNIEKLTMLIPEELPNMESVLKNLCKNI